MIIRDAKKEDFKDIQHIYAYYVLNDTATAEINVPSVKMMTERWQQLEEQHYPYLVAVENDKVIAYSYVAPYSDREAFCYSAVLSIYVDVNEKSKGIGRQLLKAIEKRLEKKGIKRLFASVSGNNQGSLSFHHRNQFEEIGCFPKAMYKFEQWIDLIWLVKQFE